MTNDTQPNRPRFSVGGLTPGSVYQLTIYSVNAKGKSKPIVIEAVEAAGGGGKAAVPSNPAAEKELLQSQRTAQDVKYSFSAGKLHIFNHQAFF